MKNIKSILIICVIMLSYSSIAQVKIFPGGNISLGNTSNPVNHGVKILVTSNKTAFANTASTITSSALIRGNNSYSTATTPDYTWYNNDLTGLFHPATNIIGISTGGTEKMRIGAVIQINTTNLNNGILNIYRTISSEQQKVLSIQGHLTADWFQTMTTRVNRPNAINYVVNLNGSDKFYIFGDGTIFSKGNYIGSDLSIKDDVSQITNALNKVNQLNGITYKLKYEMQNIELFENAKTYMGLIAQDVEAVAPEAVKRMADGTLAVCYEMLIGLLVEAIKEQQSLLESLRSDLQNCCYNNDNKTKSIIEPNDKDNLNSKSSYIKQNYPNPFNNETVIEYYLNEISNNAYIIFFDLHGKYIKQIKLLENGHGSVSINSTLLSPGMYYYSLVINGNEIETKKIILSN